MLGKVYILQFVSVLKRLYLNTIAMLHEVTNMIIDYQYDYQYNYRCIYQYYFQLSF